MGYEIENILQIIRRIKLIKSFFHFFVKKSEIVGGIEIKKIPKNLTNIFLGYNYVVLITNFILLI